MTTTNDAEPAGQRHLVHEHEGAQRAEGGTDHEEDRGEPEHEQRGAEDDPAAALALQARPRVSPVTYPR